MSALFSNNFDKYEYLSREDLGLKPSTDEQARFEYSPLSKFLNKGSKKKKRKKGAFEDTKIYWGQEWTAVKSNQRSGK